MSSSTTRALAVVSELAAGQWGLLTTAQAEREGLTRLQLVRLTDASVLERVDRGVYATASSPTEHRALRAAWLTLDPTRTAEERLADPIAAGVASHTSAAGLHRLGDLLDDEPELTLSRRKQSRRRIRLHRLPLAVDDVTLVDGIPTTTVERTVADLLRDGHDPDHVAQVVGHGARRGIIDLDDLAARLDPLARRFDQNDGRALVEHLLSLVGLDPTALARELATSTAGQELLAAGRLEALGEVLATLLPTIDVTTALDAITTSIGRFAELSDLAAVGRRVEPTTALARLQAAIASLTATPTSRSTSGLGARAVHRGPVVGSGRRATHADASTSAAHRAENIEPGV
ncbi:MAG TPA: type IV toxin-antitoxin system AbiEi family antitoxin domain-containing protein [Cellulomonas sp.]